jgi:hypothetical protein
MNNLELTLVILLLNYNRYNKYKDVIDTKYLKDNYKEIYYLYITLVELIELNNKDITLDELIAFFFAKHSEVKGNATYEGLFAQAKSIEVTDAVGDSILAAIKQRKTALELSEKAFQFTQGYASLDDVTALAKEIERPAEAAKDISIQGVSLDLEEIINSTSMQQGIRWRLDFLNKSLGSLRPGDFGMLIKRPESGGTAFCADLEMFAADQVDRPILHFNNEEEDKKVIFRMFMSYFGCTADQLKTNWRKYNEVFQQKVAPKYRFFGIEYCNKKTIEDIISELNPSLVVYDQMSKIKGFDNDRLDLILGDIFQWARELTKQGHAALAIHQADGSAEGAKWLDMGHVANAKTSIQAECDFIICMGKTNNPNEEQVRFLNISKNKLLGDSDSLPYLRHGRGEIIIQPEIMRFKDIVNYG